MPKMSLEDRMRVIATIPPEDRAAAYAVLAGLLPGWNRDEDPDPLIDGPMFAQLAGVASNTPKAWQQRTREGRERVAFPEPGESKYADKPQWHAISQALRFLMDSHRWPRGSSAREGTRADVRTRLSFVELMDSNPDLARELAALDANDTTPRTIQGWRSLRTRRSTRAAA